MVKYNSLSKDTHSLLSVSKLANLALEYSRLGNAGNNLVISESIG